MEPPTMGIPRRRSRVKPERNFLLPLSRDFSVLEATTPESIHRMEAPNGDAFPFDIRALMRLPGQEGYRRWRKHYGRSEDASVITDEADSPVREGIFQEAQSLERELGESVDQASPPPPVLQDMQEEEGSQTLELLQTLDRQTVQMQLDWEAEEEPPEAVDFQLHYEDYSLELLQHAVVQQVDYSWEEQVQVRVEGQTLQHTVQVQVQVDEETVPVQEQQYIEQTPSPSLPPPQPPRAKKPRVKRIRAKVLSDDPPKPKKTPKAKVPKAPRTPKRQAKKKKTEVGETSSVSGLQPPPRKRGRPPKNAAGVQRKRFRKDVLVMNNGLHLVSGVAVEFLVDELARRLMLLSLRDMFDMVPFQGCGAPAVGSTVGAMIALPNSKQKYRAKVVLDVETLRVYNMLDKFEPEDEETSAKWDAERRKWEKLVKHFISVMHIVQGNRTFSRWKGSVVNSCVGVYLTQNTSDNLSSSSFINLHAEYPVQKKQAAQSQPAQSSSFESSPSDTTASSGGQCIYQVQEVEDVVKEDESTCERRFSVRRALFTDTPITKSQSNNEINKKVREPVEPVAEVAEVCVVNSTPSMDGEEGITGSSSSSTGSTTVTSKVSTSTSRKGKSKAKVEDVDLKSMSAGQRALYEAKKARPKTVAEWERIKHLVKRPLSSQRGEESADTVDWETVAATDVDTISEVIKERGMNNVLGGRIKGFLLTLKEVYNTFDLEWLRDVDPKVAKNFLATFYGMGPKSIDCVRLLTLEQVAFPVDVNVGRICIRLGWVPIESLPEGLHFHNLDLYPIGETVQKYLWPRLCKLDQPTLYELHYQLITCGKVFCTKTNPNCRACPLKGGCQFYLSKLRETLMVEAEPTYEVPKEWGGSLVLEKEAEYRPTNYNQPIIEEPPEERAKAPEAAEPATTTTRTTTTTTVQESTDWVDSADSDVDDSFFELVDIEDLFKPPENVPHIDLTKRAYAEDRAAPASSASRELVVYRPPEHPPHSTVELQLKTQYRLRTVHKVYVLPDEHPIVTSMFGRRDVDDTGHYLIVIYNDPHSYDNSFVEGTVLIPCRTAMNGNFPLNGTYFQVNEVFADHGTSVVPLKIPRSLLWNLSRCPVYFGTTVTAIFRDCHIDQVRTAFWLGYLCIRGLDRACRAPRPLSARLHNTANRTKKTQSSSKRKARSTNKKK